MGRGDGECELWGVIALDDGFFSTIKPEGEKGKLLNRGRGSQKKSKVLVIVESVPLEGETTRNG